jgi:hypothetical protein
MTTRRSRSKKERARLFNLHGGKCHICGMPIKAGEKWELEHVIAWELTRDDSDENVKPAHDACHKPKTHGEDRPRIRKAQNQEAAYMGFKKSSKSINSRGFTPPQNPKRKEHPMPVLSPRRPMYGKAGSNG